MQDRSHGGDYGKGRSSKGGKQAQVPHLQYQCHLMAVSAEPSEPHSRMVSCETLPAEATHCGVSHAHSAGCSMRQNAARQRRGLKQMPTCEDTDREQPASQHMEHVRGPSTAI